MHVEYTENEFPSCVFRSPPDRSLTFRDNQDNNEEAFDESTSSEEEDIDHSEHFFQLAKTQVSQLNSHAHNNQYEEILAKDPYNTTIRERYEILIRNHEVEEGNLRKKFKIT